MALSSKERYATDPEYRERRKAYSRAADERRKARGLSDEEKERRREYMREYARKRRADTKKNSADNARLRERYATDEQYRKKRIEAACNYAVEHKEEIRQYPSYRAKRIAGSINVAKKRVAGWRWLPATIMEEGESDSTLFDNATDWYSRWFDSLDNESAEPVWE